MPILSSVQPGYMQCATLVISSVHSGLKAPPYCTLTSLMNTLVILKSFCFSSPKFYSESRILDLKNKLISRYLSTSPDESIPRTCGLFSLPEKVV